VPGPDRIVQIHRERARVCWGWRDFANFRDRLQSL